MPNPKKVEQVKQIINTLQKNPNFVLVNFDKTNHQTLEGLRKDLRKDDALFTVVKNTLLEKAIERLSLLNKAFEEFAKSFLPLQAKTALIVLQNNWSKALKTFYQASQKEKSLSFKFAIIDQQVYNTDQVVKIAQLPSEEELMTSIVNRMRNPILSLVYSIKFHLNKFTYILQQKSKLS